jgi:hypothetical protein
MNVFRREIIKQKTERVADRRSRFTLTIGRFAHKAMSDLRQVSRNCVGEGLRAVQPSVAARISTPRSV